VNAIEDPGFAPSRACQSIPEGDGFDLTLDLPRINGDPPGDIEASRFRRRHKVERDLIIVVDDSVRLEVPISQLLHPDPLDFSDDPRDGEGLWRRLAPGFDHPLRIPRFLH